jgi:hypothetical protein
MELIHLAQDREQWREATYEFYTEGDDLIGLEVALRTRIREVLVSNLYSD